MSDIVIEVENLGKKYTIGHQTDRGRYTAPRDVWMRNARSLWRKIGVRTVFGSIKGRAIRWVIVYP